MTQIQNVEEVARNVCEIVDENYTESDVTDVKEEIYNQQIEALLNELEE